MTVKRFAELMFSLEHSNNESDGGMKRIFEVVKKLLPTGHVVPPLETLRKLLASRLANVQRVHACSQHCVLFCGEHANDDFCPATTCKRPRYFVDSNGFKQPVNIYRFIPLKDQLRAKYLDVDSARTLRFSTNMNDNDAIATDITESPGFKEKVIDIGFLEEPRSNCPYNVC